MSCVFMKQPAKRLATLVLALALVACQTTGGPASADLPLSDKPLLGKFVWHDLITDDVDAARRFYSGLFGWTFKETTRPGGGPYVLISSQGYFIAGMVELADPGEGQDYSRWLGYLSVMDVDAAATSTQAEGGEVVVAPRDLGNIARVAAIEDPQGAVLGLVRSKVGDPIDVGQAGAGRVGWNELLAADDDAAIEFYRTLAGFEVEKQQRRGGEYVTLRIAGVERAGILQRPAKDIKPVWLTYFGVADPAAAARRAGELGGEVLLAPSPDVREGTLALVIDPSGAVLALQKWPL